MKKKITLFHRTWQFALLAAALSSCTELTSADITAETIQILGPADSLFTKSATVSFWWEDNEKVEQYEMQVVTPDFINPTLILDSALLDNSLSHEVPGEAIYGWRVRGVNEGSETGWFFRMFVVDLTAPYLPVATAMDGDTVTTTATPQFTWTSEDPPVSSVSFPVGDSLYICQKNDSATVRLKYFLEAGTVKSKTVDVLNDLEGAGKYYWSLVSVDRAGNRKKSGWFSFVVQ